MALSKKSSFSKAIAQNATNITQFNNMKSYADHLKTTYSASKLDSYYKNPYRNNYITSNLSRPNGPQAPTPPHYAAPVSAPRSPIHYLHKTTKTAVASSRRVTSRYLPNAAKKQARGNLKGSTSAIGISMGKSVEYEKFTLPTEPNAYCGKKKGSVVVEGQGI